MNCRKKQKIAKTISTFPRKNERNYRQKCPKEEKENCKIDLPNVRKIQVRGTQTTLSTTMAWQGMWSNSKDRPNNLSSSHIGITPCPLSSKRTFSEVSIYKNLTVRKTPCSRFKSRDISKLKGKPSGSHSSSTLCMTPCSEASSDLIEVGEICETLPIDDCIVGHIGVQTDFFAAEYPQFGSKTHSRRNNKMVLRNSQIWGSKKKKQLKNFPAEFSSNHIPDQALNTKSCKSLNTISTQLTEEIKLPSKKPLQGNKIQVPAHSPRISDVATLLGSPEQYFFFPEDHLTKTGSSSEFSKHPASPSKCASFQNSDETILRTPEQSFFFPESQLTHSSSSLEFMKQTVSPPKCSMKEGLDVLIEARATQFTPSLIGIPEERHETQETILNKERTLSDLSKRVGEYEMSKCMYSTPSNSLPSSEFSSTALTFSHENSYAAQNLPQIVQKHKETIDSQLIQNYRMTIQYQSSETNPSVTTSQKYFRDCQEPVSDLRNYQGLLNSCMNSQENQEIVQFEKVSPGLGEQPQAENKEIVQFEKVSPGLGEQPQAENQEIVQFEKVTSGLGEQPQAENQEIVQFEKVSPGLGEQPQVYLTTTLNKMDIPTEPVMGTKNSNSDPNTKLLGEVDRGLPNGDEHKSELTLRNDKLQSESGDRFHEDMKVNVNQDTTFKSHPESLSTTVSIMNSDNKQYLPVVQPSSKSDYQESQNPNISGARTESKKKEPLSNLQTMRTPRKYSRPNESGIYALNKRLTTCSTEPKTPVSIYSLLQRPITKPILSENSKSLILSDSLDEKQNNLCRTNASVTQKSSPTNNENQRQQFICTRDRQISPFLRYTKPEYKNYIGSAGTSKKFGISLHKRRPPLRARRMVDSSKKDPMLTRHLPVGSVTSDFLNNKENRSFAVEHVASFKNINSKNNHPTKCTVIEKKNVHIPDEKKVPQQNPSKENRISVSIKCKKGQRPPATSDVAVKSQDSLTQKVELIVDTKSLNDDVGSNATEKSRSIASQTIVSVRNTKVADGQPSTTTSSVTWGVAPPKTKRSSSSPEFWKSIVLPRYVQKCLSLSQVDTDGTTLPVTKHISNTQSVYTVSSESFQSCFNNLDNDVSQFSESSGSLKSILKPSHSVKMKCQNSDKSFDTAMHSVNKNENIRSPPEISSRGTMSNEERMVQRLKRDESIRQWVLKKQGKSSPNTKPNLWGTDRKRTKCSSSMNSQSISPRTPTKEENKMNLASDLKCSQPVALMESKSRHSEDSCSSKIKEKSSTSEKHTKYTQKGIETKKTRVLQKKKQKTQMKSTYMSPELNSCRDKGKNDSIPEAKSQIIEKNTEDKGLHCELNITSQNTSCATACTQASEEYTLPEEAPHGIQKRHIKATKSLKQQDQSHLKTPVPVSVVTLNPLPLYSMMGYTPEGNVIFQRVNKIVPKEPQAEDSRVSTQIKPSNSQKKYLDDLQYSPERSGQFIPHPLPPPNHVRGLKCPLTKSSCNFERLKPQGSEYSVKDTKKCGYFVVKDTKALTCSVPQKRNGKPKESRITTSSTTQTEDHLIKDVSKNHTTENKRHLESTTKSTKSARENVDKSEHGEETEENISPKDTGRSRIEIATKACQTDRRIIYPKRKARDTKDREMTYVRVNDNSTPVLFSKLLNTNFLRYVNQTQKPRERKFPKDQHSRIIKSAGNKFRNWDKIDEATSEQEKDCSSERNSSLDHSKKHTSNFHKNFKENRIPSSSRRAHLHQTTQNLQQRYQQHRRGQLSNQTRGKGSDTKRDEKSDSESQASYPHREKYLPTKEVLSSKRATRFLICKFSDVARKLGQRILHKNHSHHSTTSSLSGSKSRRSFESSSYSSRPQNSRGSRGRRCITSPKSTALYANRSRVSNSDCPSHTEERSSFREKHENVLKQVSSTTIDSHHFQSSFSESTSNFQETVSQYSKGVQCSEAEPSTYINNRVSKVSYTIFNTRPKENIYWDDSVTQQKYSENSCQETSLKGITTLFQKNDTHSQSEKFNKDISRKSDKNRRLRDRTPSY